MLVEQEGKQQYRDCKISPGVPCQGLRPQICQQPTRDESREQNACKQKDPSSERTDLNLCVKVLIDIRCGFVDSVWVVLTLHPNESILPNFAVVHIIH